MKNLLSILTLLAFGSAVVGCSADSEEAAVDPTKPLPVQGAPNSNKPTVGVGGAGGGAAPAAPGTSLMGADR